MPRVRLSNPELYALKGILLGTGKSTEWALANLGMNGATLDDPSEQALETLIFKCIDCGLWRSIEDSDPTSPGACLACWETSEPFVLDEDYYFETDATGYFG